jgi:hypothetical protein
MRKAVMILGTVLIATMIFISGSAVAGTWHYIDHVESSNYCTNPNYAVGYDDRFYASIGINGSPPTLPVLGAICLDLGSGNEMPPSQNFTVFASSTISEIYDVWVTDDPADVENHVWVGENSDTANHYYTTPSTPDMSWRWVYIQGLTGDDINRDPAYGPEIDAVGWYEP